MPTWHTRCTYTLPPNENNHTMKDIKITGQRQKKELRAWLVCFVIAFALNAYAIIAYKGAATELITSLLYVLTFSLALYAAWVAIRIVFYAIRKIFKSKHP